MGRTKGRPKVAQEPGPLDGKRLVHPGGKGSSMVPVGGVAGQYMQRTPKGDRRGSDASQALPGMEGNPPVFPGVRGDQLSDLALSMRGKRQHATAVGTGGSRHLDRVSKRPAVPHGL